MHYVILYTHIGYAVTWCIHRVTLLQTAYRGCRYGDERRAVYAFVYIYMCVYIHTHVLLLYVNVCEEFKTKRKNERECGPHLNSGAINLKT